LPPRFGSLKHIEGDGRESQQQGENSMAGTAQSVWTTGEVAEQIGVPSWMVRRLFTDKFLPEPPRAGRTRMLRTKDVQRVVAALAARGWLPKSCPDNVEPVADAPAEVIGAIQSESKSKHEA
jgi:hypothetical protein